MASGRINGTCTGGSSAQYNFWIEWIATAYPAKGYWHVTATAYLQRNDNIAGSAYNLDIAPENKKISVAGASATGTVKGIDTRNFAKVRIAQVVNVVVRPDASGYASINISALFPRVSSNLTGGSASKKISLGYMDLKPPVFSQQPTVVSVTQTTASVLHQSSDAIDSVEYSVDGQKTWHAANIPEFTITGLSANTDYTVYTRIRKKSNQLITVSQAVKFRTLPIYVTAITLPETIEIDVGQSIDLPAVITPGNASIQTLRVESDNPEIISVSGTRITGITKGSAILTVSATDGSGVIQTTMVTTLRRVSGISISPSEIVLAKGTSVEITVSFTPSDADNKAVTLVSSDPTIASVDGMTVTAVENGTVTVTATSADGGFTAVSAISVVGDYTWYEYAEPLDILNSEDIEKIHANMLTIRSMLLVNGYAVEALIDVAAAKDIPLTSMRAFLQSIEHNLDRISDNDCQSVYYVGPHVIGNIAPDKLDIWRWIQVLNDMYNMLSGTIGKWQYVLCNDGYPTINGSKLIIRGDSVG